MGIENFVEERIPFWSPPASGAVSEDMDESTRGLTFAGVLFESEGILE